MLDWSIKYWVVFTFALYGLSVTAIGIYSRYAINRGILDLPNPRSSHKVITPRGAGFPVVLLFAGLLAWVVYQFHLSYETVLIFGPALIIGYLGFLDDKKSLSAVTRLGVQAVCAVIILMAMGANNEYILPLTFIPIWAHFLVLTIGIIWFTNLFNFMDGMDGIAGTEALFFFGLASYIFWQLGSDVLMLLSWGLFALSAGFLTWNWPPAKVFLGDAGSGFLGAIMAIFALIASAWYGVSIFVWLILTGVFWFDATVTLIRRLLSKENIFTAHCTHAYQRLLQRQFRHRTVLFMMIAINGFLGWMAYMVFEQPDLGWTMFIYALMLLTGLYLIVEYLKPMFKTWHSTS